MIEMSIVKAHCRLEPDFDEDDVILDAYIRASWRYVETWTRRKLYTLNSDPGFDTDEKRLLLDDDIRVAMLLLIGHWYENREAVNTRGATSTLPLAVEALLQPYRIYGV